MSFELTRDGHQLSLPAASAVNPKQAVKVIGTSAAFVVPCGTLNEEPFGVVKATAGASGLNQGERVTIFEYPNIVKMVAAASLGVWTDVGVGSTNGVLIPVVGHVGSVVWRVGRSVNAAVAGDTFAVYVSPKQLDVNN